MENRPMRVLAIHDLSGFGRCSLTVILPVLSAMGVQVCPVPTAVLSTHTGNLGEVVLRDLTEFITPTLTHYQKLGLQFEAVYTGFLAAPEQIDCCLLGLAQHKNALKVVDPVMGDAGRPYRTMNAAMIGRMRELVRSADVITPNLTECFLLLGEDYNHQPLTREHARSLLARLCELGPQKAVITGAQMVDGGIANIGFDSEHSAYWKVRCDYMPVSYPGTGDMFASVMVGGLLSGDSFAMSLGRATGFLERAIRNTFSTSSDPRFGVMFERDLRLLTGPEACKEFSLL